jgi:hypothetical protein
MIDTDYALDRAPVPQHMSALQRANEVRNRQCDLKRRINSGGLRLDAVLADAADLSDDERDALDRLPVGVLVGAAHWVGPDRTRRILAAAGRRANPPTTFPEMRRVGALTVRQRHVLAAEVRERVPESRYAARST